MNQETAEIEHLRGLGVTGLHTVEQVLDGEDGATPLPPAPFSPPRLEGSPELPEPGLYFGMNDEVYHSLPALSSHGIKYLAASPMIFWARTPWLSEKKAREVAERKLDEKQHHTVGKAYHCRIMEGRAEFERRFVVELDPADFPNALVHTDQIKAAIGRFMETVPVKPCSPRKDDLVEQLCGLDPAWDRNTAAKVDYLKEAIGRYTCEQPVKPWPKVEDFMPDSGETYMRACVKADWIKQLTALDPEVEIFDVLQERFLAQHEGKSVITLEQHEQLEIAAAMVERDPELRDAFRGGYAEVTFIWNDPETGVPMKSRVDYLKIKRHIDLKTVGNQRERSIENAIRFEIASYHYNIQPRVYLEGDAVMRDLIRREGMKVIHVAEDYPYPADEVRAWALKWASHRGDVEWLWVFQQKGDAPITRGVRYQAPTVDMVTGQIVNDAKRRFRQFAETFGTDPWLDVRPIYDIHNEDIPVSATEI